MRSSDGEGRSIRSDALYPALSGEWEVPVTRNAKITPVNEGVGWRGRGASPPGSPLAGGRWKTYSKRALSLFACLAAYRGYLARALFCGGISLRRLVVWCARYDAARTHLFAG